MADRQPVAGGAGLQLQLNEFLPFELAVLANRVSQMVGRIIDRSFNLQVPDWRILVTLHRYGPLPPNEVAEKTAMDKARVSRAQRRLGDLGLVTVTDVPGDGRRKVLALQPLGAKVCSEIIPEALERERWLLQALTPAEEVALRAILAKLHAHTDAIAPDPSVVN